MTIGFKTIPSNLRIPLFFAELDNSRANNASVQLRTLVIGQQLSAGTYAAGVPVLAEGPDAVKAKAGAGSMLASMVDWYRKRDTFGELWVLPLADAGSGVAAVWTITVNAVPTATGTWALYIGDVRVPVAMSASLSTVTLVASAIAAAINANTDLPVTAAAAVGVVTVTARNKGAAMNDLLIQDNLRGALGGESTPTGFTWTLAATTPGTLNPTLDTALANLGDVQFDWIVCPYTDTTSLDAMKTFMAARWAWDKMVYGHAWSAARATLGGASTLGNARNDPHMTILPANDSPTLPFLWAANFAAAAAVSLRADPGLPLQGLPLDVWAPPVAKRFTMSERNVLLYDGMSTFTVLDDGTVVLESIITTYQQNTLSQPDDSYLWVERMYLLQTSIRDLRSFVTSTFGRFKLASDATPFRAGANIVTTGDIRDALLGRYREQMRRGWVQEYETFKANLQVERDASNRCRVNGLLPIIPIDQLRQFCANVQFRQSTGE